MQKVKYSPASLIMMCIAMLGFILVGVIMFGSLHGKGAFAGFLLLAVGLFGFPVMVRYLLGGCTILEYDHNFVTYHGILGAKRVRWSEIESLEVEKQTYNWIASNRFLKLRGPFGLLGYASVTERLLARQHRPIETLMDQIESFAAGGVENSAEQPRQPVGMPAPRSTGVIGEAPIAVPSRPMGFGRKGL